MNNALHYKVTGSSVMIDHTKWYNNLLDASRIKKKVGVSLRTISNLLKTENKLSRLSMLLPIKNTERMFCESLSPILPSAKRCKVLTADNVFEDFASQVHPRYDLYNDENYGAILPNGGWDFAKRHLKRYGEIRPNKITYEKIFKVIEKYGEDWLIPVFNTRPRSEDIDAVYVKPESYSGLISGKFFGTTKRQSFHLSNIIAKKLYDLTGSKLLVDTSLKTVGGREKLSKYSKLGEVTTTRCVLQEESCLTQFKQIYSRKITAAYKTISNKWGTSHGIGATLSGCGWDNFQARLTRYSHKIICGDWSSHDTFVDEKTMIVTFGILRAMWPKSKIVDRHFFFFTTGHVYKRIVVPGGFVYRVNGGIMSGCPFTSHINTICCKIEILLCLMELGIKIQSLFTYGDDWIGAVKREVTLPRNVEKKFEELVGIEIKDLMLGEFSGGLSKHTGVSFLQTYSFNGEPGRDFDRIIQKIRYCDEKSRKSIRRRIDLVSNILMGNIGNEKVTNFLIEYLTYLCARQGLAAESIVTSALANSYRLRCKSDVIIGEHEQHLLNLSDPDKYYGFKRNANTLQNVGDALLQRIMLSMFGTQYNT